MRKASICATCPVLSCPRASSRSVRSASKQSLSCRRRRFPLTNKRAGTLSQALANARTGIFVSNNRLRLESNICSSTARTIVSAPSPSGRMAESAHSNTDCAERRPKSFRRSSSSLCSPGLQSVSSGARQRARCAFFHRWSSLLTESAFGHGSAAMAIEGTVANDHRERRS